MSLNRFAKQRDANEPEIITAFELAGASVVSIDTPCDLLVGFADETILIEVKTEKGIFTPEQKKFHSTWKGNYAVVRTIEQALEVVMHLKKLAAIRKRCGRHLKPVSEVNNVDPANEKRRSSARQRVN